MFRVLSCLTVQHDWRLVVLAAVVCFLASLVAMRLFHRALATGARARANWIAAAGAVTGAGIWSTHFIAMLAYHPGFAVAYDLGLTVLSLFVAAILTCAGMALAVHRPVRWSVPLGGGVIGGGIASMHYLGMSALELPGHVSWSIGLVATAITFGIVLGAMALAVAVRGDSALRTLAAALLLTLAIVCLHFTAMGAVDITPDPLRVINPLSISPWLLAITVASAITVVLSVGALGALVDQRMRQQAAWLNATLHYMRQGLLMFDAEDRVLVWNRRYVEMYRLPPGSVQRGSTLRQLLELRRDAGTFEGDVERYIVERVAGGRLKTYEARLPDGRTVAVSNQPMRGGGWVSTHEDITDRQQAHDALIEARAEAQRAEQEARTAHQHLLDAFDVVPEALVLFDAEDRFVLWNRRYAEIYAKSADMLAPGRRFEDLLRAEVARGHLPDAVGCEEEWVKCRLAQHFQDSSSHEQHLDGDRWLRVEERRTSDGGSIGVRIDITELKRREASFRLLFEGNPVPMWVYDHQTMKILAVNDAAIDHYGYSRERFLAMTLLDIRPEEHRERLRKMIRAGGTQSQGSSWRHLKADGTEIDVEIYSRAMSYQGHQASLVAAIDMTERKRAENELRRAQTFLNTVVENIPATLFVKDVHDLKFVLTNRAGEELLGQPRDKIIGKRARDLVPQAGDAFEESDREALRCGGDQVTLASHSLEVPDKGTRLVNSTKLVIRDDRGDPEYLIAIIEDVTERRQMELRAAHLAHHDPLTDLPNRAAFLQQLESAVEDATKAGSSLALMFIDLDRFKEVNDVFGHAVGDMLLQEISRRLLQAGEGASVARLGGDEFTLIATDGGQPVSAQAQAERLLAAAADEFEIDGHKLRIGLSIGVAIFPSDGEDAMTLLANADAALYRAKDEGRGNVRFFEAEMDKRLRERRALQQDLQIAMDRGELVLHYQPQARIDGEIIGFEALARWYHPRRGEVPPSTFIPLAEESGLIILIGEWVLREACREAASWPRPLQIAINLSPAQFRHGDLPGLVHSILLETGLSSRRLELEITEGVLIGDFSRALAILCRLKSLGVRVAMDDFGTGYSSLSYLQSFPFDKIKIDQSFISNVDRSPQSAAIIRAVIGLGRGLNLPVVAEGVETSEQLAFLAREACDEVQGFLVGRPSRIDSYSEFVGRSTELDRRTAVTG